MESRAAQRPADSQQRAHGAGGGGQQEGGCRRKAFRFGAEDWEGLCGIFERVGGCGWGGEEFATRRAGRVPGGGETVTVALVGMGGWGSFGGFFGTILN